ncbi:MAG: hypothetical protein Q8S94_01995 [Pseudohongiella sp.]|nr:hypothetical protein [Pseudohongiella sp.]
MWIHRSEEPNHSEFEQLLPGADAEPLLEPVFDVIGSAGITGNMAGVDGAESDAHEQENPVRSPLQRGLPIAVSVLVHLGLLIMVRELMVSPAAVPGEFVAPPASIQISFRPRPVQQETLAEPPVTQDLPDEPVIEMPSEAPLAESPLAETQPSELRSESPPEPVAPTEPPSQAPRLVAPALLDLRDIIRNQAQNDETSRGYNNIDCDERQRRNDLIDCGDEDTSGSYNFAEAELNDTAAFFAELEAPAANYSSEPRDATNPDTRANVARDNLTGNLGAGPLIRSVMGQP